MFSLRASVPLLLLAACSPAPTPAGPTPEPTAMVTAEPTADATATPSATAAPSSTSQPSAPPVPYTGTIKSAQVVAGIDKLVASVDRDLGAATTKKKFTDGVALLMKIGPIGIRVHDEFWVAALAADMKVDMEDLAAFFEDPKTADDPTMHAGIAKVKSAFAAYKAKGKELESGLPEASQTSCDAAKKQHTDLKPKLPAEGAKMTKAVLDVLFPFLVLDQAVKRCQKNGIE